MRTLAVLLMLVATAAWAQGEYKDGATSDWFKSLSSHYTGNCCDQADCKRAASDYRDGAWWALSNRTGQWVRIAPEQITSDVSIFKDAVLCEGDPAWDGNGYNMARVYCFAPPPIGF